MIQRKRNSLCVIAPLLLIHLYSILMYIEQEWMLVFMLLIDAFLLSILLIIQGDNDMNISISLFYIYITLYDFLGPSVPMMWAVLEWTIIVCILVKILNRLNINSEDIGDNFGIAFCDKGDKSPWLAKIVSPYTLQAYGIAPVFGDCAMIPSRSGFIKRRKIESLTNWTILDTRQKLDKELVNRFRELDGKSIGPIDCIRMIHPFMDALGIKRSLTPGGYKENLLESR